MSDGTNFILGQSNSADSTTILTRTSHDDVAAPRPAGEQRPTGSAKAGAADVAFFIEDEGDGLLVVSDFGTAVEGQSGNAGGTGVVGSSGGAGTGVMGMAEQSPVFPGSIAIGVDGMGLNGATGVRGRTSGTNPSTGRGGIAVHAIDVERLGFAGMFEGQVVVEGTFNATGLAIVRELQAGSIQAQSKIFRIDHPLDPANKYLIHTAVESPDMKTMYDGVVMLNAKGEATVQLPEWFEALNKDFRYQMTPIGVSAPGLYIAEEVSHSRFTISGGTAGTKVSWQVTGTRRDAWAEAHRNPVEQVKPPEERGRYLNPELHGADAERVIGPEHHHSHWR